MRIVGDHLAREATARRVPSERDLFGRSAFNRYYYSAFLAVRSVLRRIEPSWSTPTHQSVPVVLKGEVLRRIKTQIQASERTGMITHSQGEQYYRSAAIAATELSNFLTSARETRRLADYEPETRIVDDGKGTH